MTTAAAASKAGTKAAKSAKKEVAAAAIPATDGTTPAAPAPKKASKKKTSAASAVSASIAVDADGGSVGATTGVAVTTAAKASSSAPKATAAANQSTTEAISILEDEIRNVKKDVDNEVIKRLRAHYIKSKLDAMTEEEKLRFEFFMRSHLPRNKIKDIMTKTFEGTKYSLAVTDDMAIIVGSLTKLLVGEMCDIASEIMRGHNDPQGGITAEHLKESYRRMQQSGKIGRPADSHFAFSRGNYLQHLDTTVDFHELDIAEGEDVDTFYDRMQERNLQIQTELDEQDLEQDESMELSPSPLQGESIHTFPISTQQASSSKGKYDVDEEEEENGGMEEVKDGSGNEEEGNDDDWMNEVEA